MEFRPVSINASMEDLIQTAMNQNFVPVIDDKKIFIGIVTRKDIIKFCFDTYVKTGKEEKNYEIKRSSGCNDRSHESEG